MSGFMEGLRKWAKENPLCAKILAQQYRIEQLERELAASKQAVQHANDHADAAIAELAAEKALADELEKVAHGVSWDHPARAAYRKARGL